MALSATFYGFSKDHDNRKPTVADETVTDETVIDNHKIRYSDWDSIKTTYNFLWQIFGILALVPIIIWGFGAFMYFIVLKNKN